MIYYFDSDVAMEVGVNGAIILQNIAFWVKKNEANEAHFHDGCFWTYNSQKAFQKLYPFWTERVIKYTLKKLKDDGYILVQQYGKDKMNHTNWYTVTEKGWALLPQRAEAKEAAYKKASFDETNLSHRRDKNDFSTNYTDINGTDGKQKDARARKRTLAVPFDHPSPELLEAWEGFVEYRKSIRTPLNERAAKLTANKLEKLAPGDDAKKAALLNQSVERGWKGIYPLDSDKRKRGAKRYGETQTVEEMYEEAQEILKNGGGIL